MAIEHCDVVCTFCGALCDDLKVTVEDNKITNVSKACSIGKAKISHALHHRAEYTVRGQSNSQENALQKAVEILANSKHPLIYGLSSTTCEAQKEAIALAELTGASIDSTSSVCHGPGTLAKQIVGFPTCTLGEVKNRADLVIFWGCNPLEAHQRHFARYSVLPKGQFVSGQKDRFKVVVDVRKTKSSKIADMFVQVQPNKDYEVISVLRALLKGEKFSQPDVGGVPLAELEILAEKLKTCRYGVLFYGMGLTMSRGKYLNILNAVKLVQELNQFTRFTVIPMRGHGNVAGAEQTLSWTTGYPFAVNFSRGYPQYNPGEYSAVDLLAREEVDSVLVLASDPAATLPAQAKNTMEKIPVIVLDPHYNETTKLADVVIPTAMAGIGVAGSFYRMDGVPLHLRQLVQDNYLSDVQVLQNLKERLRKNAENY